MKIVFLSLLYSLVSTQLLAQQRKDLIWEYKKFQSNDSHLEILLTEQISECTDEELKAVLDSAWTKKQILILLQTLGFLNNPLCTKSRFSENEIGTAVDNYNKINTLSSDFHFDKSSLEKLYETYITSPHVEHLSHLITSKQLIYNKLDILLIAYKYELKLQLWVKPHNSLSEYIFIKSFDITDPNVSLLGPKSRYGDQRTPEGIYRLEFYPSLRWSDFYLAFRINYPNQYDLTRRKFWRIWEKSGGDINIHGSCVSIGCIPIGNPDIIELFLLVRANQIQGTSVNIHIYPLMYNQDYSERTLKSSARDDIELINFWQSLGKIYESISRHHKIPRIFMNNTTGYYQLSGV